MALPKIGLGQTPKERWKCIECLEQPGNVVGRRREAERCGGNGEDWSGHRKPKGGAEGEAKEGTNGRRKRRPKGKARGGTAQERTARGRAMPAEEHNAPEKGKSGKVGVSP